MKKILTISLSIFLSISLNAKNPEKRFLEAKQKAPYDAIIVPGVPYNDSFWTKVLEGRVVWAYYLYTQGIAKNIIFSGGAVYTPYIESEIMAMMAIELGVPEQNVFTETKAEHSVENVYYSSLIAKNKGFEKIALATDPVQSKMMQLASKGIGVKIDFIPFITDIIEQIDIKQPIINQNNAFVANFISLDERESKFQRFKGTIGLKIEYQD